MTAAPSLSARESEVLEQVASHATNAEIAARLFISVRTVESHVAALLRKTGAADRRQLASLAGTGDVDSGRVSLPAPASTFVGRSAERAELTAALATRRLVTALGPGGIGKTRLALSVTADVRARFADGDCYVDLVSVTAPAALAPAIAAALGVGDQQGRTPDETIARWLAQRHLLLVLDNCEHLLDAVADLLERLLAGSAGLAVLATSRARLGVPGEWVFQVPGLSVDDTGSGDAVDLFLERAIAAGADPVDLDPARVAAVCRALDGSALAIELAAARSPSLGLDGVEAGLHDRLDLLMSGRRSGGRHRSLRAALTWSAELLREEERAVLRRVTVFAGAFSAESATTLLEGWEPVVPSVRGALADLADQSLLVAVRTAMGTRYRALETVRQFGDELLAAADETAEAHVKHLAWCRIRAEALPLPLPDDIAGWRRSFDGFADDARAAIGWAVACDDSTASAEPLAARFADLAFARGLPAEAQRMYEQAAGCASDAARAAELLGLAAGAAEARQFGNDAMRLRETAAAQWIAAGRPGEAAVHFARIAELINRASGIMADPLPVEAARPLIDEARRLAGPDPGHRVSARILLAEASLQLPGSNQGVTDAALAEAVAAGDMIAESAALDSRCAVRLVSGDLAGALADARRRVTMLESVPLTAALGFEYTDALLMEVECCCAVGDLAAGRRLADTLMSVPCYAEEAHLATARMLLVTCFSGDFATCLALAERFRDGWERAGRPRASNLALSARAAAAAAALTGQRALAADWRGLAGEIAAHRREGSGVDLAVFDPLPLLHDGRLAEANRMLEFDTSTWSDWFTGLWRPWVEAYRCEAQVLSGSADAATIEAARRATNGAMVASLLVERAAALHESDPARLPALADRLDASGAAYQAARTRVMAGDPAGAAWMSAAGVTPMPWPLPPHRSA